MLVSTLPFAAWTSDTCTSAKLNRQHAGMSGEALVCQIQPYRIFVHALQGNQL